MRFLDWLSRTYPVPPPRSHEEIRAALEEKEAPNLTRLSKTEESLLSLTAEAGLEDLRRRLEDIRDV